MQDRQEMIDNITTVLQGNDAAVILIIRAGIIQSLETMSDEQLTEISITLGT